jgi:hypothetical protein
MEGPGASDTAFRREWTHFADCIRDGRLPRTLADGLADLKLGIIKAMPPKSGETNE